MTGFVGEFTLEIIVLMTSVEWYYSPFNLVVSEAIDTHALTTSSFIKPTASPIRGAPVSEPTEIPVDEPSSAPVSDTPVDEPIPKINTAEPTIAPVESPVERPHRPPQPTPEPISYVASFVISYEAPGAIEPSFDEYNNIFIFTVNYLNQSVAEYFATEDTKHRTMSESSVSKDTKSNGQNKISVISTTVPLQYTGLLGGIDWFDFVNDAVFNIRIRWIYINLLFDRVLWEYLPSSEDMFLVVQRFINDPSYAEAVTTNCPMTPFANVISTILTEDTPTDRPSVSVTDVPVPRSPRAQKTRRQKT
jgi:hypothetical protein